MSFRLPMLLAASAFLAGCMSYLPPPEPPPFAGVRLQVHGPTDLIQKLLLPETSAWRAAQKAEVSQTILTDGDVWLVRPVEMPALAAAGTLHRVPEELTREGGAYDWRGLLRVYGTQLVQWDGIAHAVPLAAEAPVCLYRADLLGDPARQARFKAWLATKRIDPIPLAAPATWQEFSRLAAFLHEDLKQPSLPPLPRNDAALVSEFFQSAASFARRAVREDEEQGEGYRQEMFFFHYDEATGKPRLATPGFVAALELMDSLQAHRGEGDAALLLVDAGELARLEAAPATRGKYAACPVPGSSACWNYKGAKVDLKEAINRVPYIGGAGWLAVVPKSARSPEAAWSLLADLTGAERSGQIARTPAWGGAGIRTEQLLRDGWGSFGVEGVAARQLRDAIGRTMLASSVRNPVYVLRTPDAAERGKILARHLREALSGKRKPVDALSEAAIEWEKLDAATPGKALAEYKRSVGLVP